MLAKAEGDDAAADCASCADTKGRPVRQRYCFGGDFGADAAFFSDFCFLVFAVFFGLLSPIVLSFLNVTSAHRY